MFKGNKRHIDFRTLSKRQLDDLSNQWEDDARIFESRLEVYTSRAGNNPSEEARDKINRLHETGNKLWARIRLIERWRLNNTKKLISSNDTK